MSLTPPMTMMDFFHKSEGTWFSQRAVHHFAAVENESGESNLIVQVVDKDDSSVLEICSQQRVEHSLVAGAAKFSWQGNFKDGEPNPNYAAVLVDVPNPDNPCNGKFFRNQGYVEGIPVVGIYSFAEDGVLTINTEYEKNQGQERCWFITDDFRVRVSTVKLMNGVNLMAYCSERRCILPSQLDEMIEQNRQRALIQ